jgi:hypothetical protein
MAPAAPTQFVEIQYFEPRSSSGRNLVFETHTRDLTRDLTQNLSWTGGRVTLGGDSGVVIEPGNASRVGNWSHFLGVQRHGAPRTL